MNSQKQGDTEHGRGTYCEIPEFEGIGFKNSNGGWENAKDIIEAEIFVKTITLRPRGDDY